MQRERTEPPPTEFAEKCGHPWQAPIHVELNDFVVTANSEIHVLLHYLREVVIHRIGAYHLKKAAPKGSFVGIHNNQSWHVSQPSSRTRNELVETQFKAIAWTHDSHKFLERMFWRGQGVVAELTP